MEQGPGSHRKDRQLRCDVHTHRYSKDECTGPASINTVQFQDHNMKYKENIHIIFIYYIL